MRSVRRLLALAAAAGLAAAPAAAQEPAPPLWTVQPFGGLLVDAYDAGADGSRIGGLFGIEVGRRIATGVRAVASVAYARIDDVAARSTDAPLRPALTNEWTFAAVGPVVDVPIRRARLSLSLQAGAAWRRTPLVRIVGPDDDVDPSRFYGAADVSVTSLLVPGVALHVPVAHRVALVAGARSHALGYAFGFGDGGRLSPAYSLGVSYAP